MSEESVVDAMQFLADTMLVHLVPPLDLLLRKQAHPPKLCLCDHFVRNAVLQEVIPIAPEDLPDRPDAVSAVAGHVIEGILGYYLSGIPGLDLRWFPERQNEPEIDLVLTIGTRRLPVEVKYQRGGLRNDDLRGVAAFCGNPVYEAPFGLVITQSTSKQLDGIRLPFLLRTCLL